MVSFDQWVLWMQGQYCWGLCFTQSEASPCNKDTVKCKNTWMCSPSDGEMLGLAKFVLMPTSETLEGGAACPVVWP